jgi:hypothetical protein
VVLAGVGDAVAPTDAAGSEGWVVAGGELEHATPTVAIATMSVKTSLDLRLG